MNLCIFTGNLTRDPEMRYTPQGTPVTDFTIAVNSGSGEKRSTEFVRCVAWEKQAETVAEYLRKGSKVLVHGSMESQQWTDKQGQPRTTVRIICRNVEFLSPKAEPVTQAELSLDVLDDPIPF